eukprot:1181013-Prorocentrum_minimum.AAC.4
MHMPKANCLFGCLFACLLVARDVSAREPGFHTIKKVHYFDVKATTCMDSLYPGIEPNMCPMKEVRFHPLYMMATIPPPPTMMATIPPPPTIMATIPPPIMMATIPLPPIMATIPPPYGHNSTPYYGHDSPPPIMATISPPIMATIHPLLAGGPEFN